MAPPGSHVWALGLGTTLTACRLVLRDLGEVWFAQHGMQTSSCPIGNIFNDSANSRGIELLSSSSSWAAEANAPSRPASGPSLPKAKAARTKPARQAK